MFTLLRLLTLGLLLLSGAALDAQPAPETPQQFIGRYYAALAAKDFEALPGFYDSAHGRAGAARLAADFECMESIAVHRWLGVQAEGDLVHVLVVLQVKEQGVEPPEYNFAQHDLKRQRGAWQIVSADALAPAEQQALLGLWRPQRELLRTDPALKHQVEWVQAQRRDAQARRRQRVPVPVE
jgi:hypothetical protein